MASPRPSGRIEVRQLRKHWYRIEITPGADVDVGALASAIRTGIERRFGSEILKRREVQELFEERLLKDLIKYVYSPRTRAARREYSRILIDAVKIGKEKSKAAHRSHFRGTLGALPLPGEEWNPYLRRFTYRGATIGFRIPRSRKWLRFLSWFFGSRPHVIRPGRALIPRPSTPGGIVVERYPRIWFKARRPIFHPGTKDDPGYRYVAREFSKLVDARLPTLHRKNKIGESMWSRELEREIPRTMERMLSKIEELADIDVVSELRRFK